jgi:hypothetical protein
MNQSVAVQVIESRSEGETDADGETLALGELLGDVPVPPGCEVEAEQVAQIVSEVVGETPG